MRILHESGHRPPATTVKEVLAWLDQTMSKEWSDRHDEIAASLRTLRNEGALLRTLFGEIARQGKWPELAGNQSFVVHRGEHYILRLNLWFPECHSGVIGDNYRRYFSISELHNHDFRFFSICLVGPGYRAEFFRGECKDREYTTGETMPLDCTGEVALKDDDVLFVEPDVDFHLQLWPDAFTATLNLIPRDEGSPPTTQYILNRSDYTVKFAIRNR